MDQSIQKLFQDLDSVDKDIQYAAFNSLLSLMEEEVDWAYEVWDIWRENLSAKDQHKRSRAAQFLSRLSISDPEKRMLADFPLLWQVTKDPKFVTARHSLQSIWRVGVAGSELKELLLHHFRDRFQSCSDEKNTTLIRFDMIQGLKSLYDQTRDESIKEMALQLIETEKDEKYKKKYAAVWKKG